MTGLLKALVVAALLAGEVVVLLTVAGLPVWAVVLVLGVQLAVTTVAIGRPRMPRRP